jgi:serine/threonine protein kinase
LFSTHFTSIFIHDQANILVDGSGCARLADFGLAMVAKNLDSKTSDASQRGYTVGWAAPEVMEKEIYSKEADMFSLAMVMVEVCYS